MTNTLTPSQITTHIKKELLKKYPSITKISVTSSRGNIAVNYQGGCNSSEVEEFLNQYQCKSYDSNEDIFKYKQKIINIDGVEYRPSIYFVDARRSYNKNQAQTVLDLVKGFAESNNKVVTLELLQSSFDGSWSLPYDRCQPGQVIIDEGGGYCNTPALAQTIRAGANILEPTGKRITVQSLHDAIIRDINFK